MRRKKVAVSMVVVGNWASTCSIFIVLCSGLLLGELFGFLSFVSLFSFVLALLVVWRQGGMSKAFVAFVTFLVVFGGWSLKAF